MKNTYKVEFTYKAYEMIVVEAESKEQAKEMITKQHLGKENFRIVTVRAINAQYDD